MAADTPRAILRKVETSKQRFVTATYAVLVNGQTVGWVHKFVQPSGLRGTPKKRVSMFTCWGWYRPGVPEDPLGYERRRDAVDQVLNSLDSEEAT